MEPQRLVDEAMQRVLQEPCVPLVSELAVALKDALERQERIRDVWDASLKKAEKQMSQQSERVAELENALLLARRGLLETYPPEDAIDAIDSVLLPTEREE